MLVEEVPWGMETHLDQGHMHSWGIGRANFPEGNRRKIRTSDKVTTRWLSGLGFGHRVLSDSRHWRMRFSAAKGTNIDLGVSDRPGLRLLWIGKEDGVKTFRILCDDRPGVRREDRVRLLGHVEAVFGSDPRDVFPGPQYPRPVPHRGQGEQALDDIRPRSPAEGDGQTGPDQVPLVPSKAAGEPHGQPESETERPGYNLQSVRAYLLKEDFRNYESTAWAAKFLDQWCSQVMRSRIEPMKKVAGLCAHRELILNYFRARKRVLGVIRV